MSIILQVELSDEQLANLAGLVQARIGAGKKGTLSVDEAAGRLGVSRDTVRRRIKAGIYPKVSGLSNVRIPENFVDRLLNPNPDA